MDVVIDNKKYYSINDIADKMLKAMKEEKQDLFNKDEKDGFEVAESCLYSKLKEMGYEVHTID